MSTGSPRNQTLSYLRQRFAAAGIRPETRRGQNFLIDLNLLRLLVQAAELQPQDVVLEVGTGTGSLTALVAPQVAQVVSVEIDPKLHQLASEALDGLPNVTLLCQDALQNKNRLHPGLLAAVRQHLQSAPGRCFKLVANLPYNIATPLISNLLAGDLAPQRMIVTVQKELADRLMAAPGTKDYGALSIWVQCQCRVELVRVLPPTAFWPRPKVHSAIVALRDDPALRQRLADRHFFHDFVRALFLHRRKFLRGELVTVCKNRLDKPQVDRILAELELSSDARAEQLDVPTVIRLADAVRWAIDAAGGNGGQP